MSRRNRRHRKITKELPDDKLVLFTNPDKIEPYRLGKPEWMPMNSTRMLLSGVPGVGKSNIIRNVIERMDPKPTCIHLVHLDAEGQSEYDWLFDVCKDVLIYSPSEFPSLANIDDPYGDLDEPSGSDEEAEDIDDKLAKLTKRPVLILDEITSDVLSPEGRCRLERHLGFTATHRNVLIMVSIQNLMSISPKARRLFDMFCLWRGPDATAHKVAAQKAGIDIKLLEGLFDLCKSRYDFICVDTSQPPDSEWRYRLSMISPVQISPA